LALNTEFNTIFNKVSGNIQSNNKGEYSSGMLQLFASMIPSTTPVIIPEDIIVSYAMPDDNRAKIDNDRFTAFFEAEIHGIDKRHHIRDPKYMRDGDL
jgi:hypothetical protein